MKDDYVDNILYVFLGIFITVIVLACKAIYDENSDPNRKLNKCYYDSFLGSYKIPKQYINNTYYGEAIGTYRYYNDKLLLDNDSSEVPMRECDMQRKIDDLSDSLQRHRELINDNT